jgi:hypothetical protein
MGVLEARSKQQSEIVCQEVRSDVKYLLYN